MTEGAPLAGTEAMFAGAIPRLTLADVRATLTEVMALGHFFVPPGTVLRCLHVANEEIPWEIFRGRLLDPAHTRERQAFESWNIEADQETAPRVSAHLAFSANRIYVTRGILCYVWEGYDAGGNVIESREIPKLVTELMGTIALEQLGSLTDLRKDLAWLVFRAVIGLSRLPLNSIEAPLPGFSLGTFGYFAGRASRSEPLHEVNDLIKEKLSSDQPWLSKAKLFEFVVRATSMKDIQTVTQIFSRRWQEIGDSVDRIPALIRTSFNEIALSPYVDFVDKILALGRCLVSQATLRPEEQIDWLSHLLRQTARHLTAYDLVTFHHRGANYPDALLLDTVLREYLTIIDDHTDLVLADDHIGRFRRRALRQGWLLRHICAGLPVPETPTSPGENARILPAPFVRVPEEQIGSPGHRSRRLFADCPLPALSDRACVALKQALADLRNPDELRELGTALFLDRPLGRFKAVGETDLTPLLSYVAFSQSVAARRLDTLKKEFPSCDLEAIRVSTDLGAGLPVRPSGRLPHPASVSLDDCFRVADDFALLAATHSSIRALLECFDFTPLSRRFPLEFLEPARQPLIVNADSVGPSEQTALLVYDEERRVRVELRFDSASGYRRHLDREVPAGGLTATRVSTVNDDGELVAHDLKNDTIVLPPRL